MQNMEEAKFVMRRNDQAKHVIVQQGVKYEITEVFNASGSVPL